MEDLASAATEQAFERDEPDIKQQKSSTMSNPKQQQPPQQQQQQQQRTNKRNSDDMYLSAEEKLDINNLIACHDSYIFPRDDQLNYICVFQGCAKPILRGLNTEEYFAHLQEHATQSDKLLSNMLRRADSEGDKKIKRRRANSTNTYNTVIAPKKRANSVDEYEREDASSIGSPNSSPGNDSPPITPRKRQNSDEYNIPLKPSSRGVQLRDQMLRYGLHLFRIDSEGKYICFFDECSLHMMTNFSRHIAKHEKNGDKIKQELLHLCSPPVVQQQLQQHPSLMHASHPSHSQQGPLQQLLLRHQQEALQLQQIQQQQQLAVQSRSQLENLQSYHAMQFHQLQMQHNQQLQMLHQTLSSSPSHPQQQQQQAPPVNMYSQQDMMQQKRKPSVPELHLLSQVRDESDLALMRTQISKMLEDSSRNRPTFPHKRSLSLAYYPSPSMQDSPSIRHPYLGSNSSPQLLSSSPPPPSHSQQTLYSPRLHEPSHASHKRQQMSEPSMPPSHEASPPTKLSPSSSPLSPPSPPSEIKWIFPKSTTKPVMSK